MSYFVLCVFAVMSKASLLRPMSKNFPPIFSFRSFMVLRFTFKTLIHFWVNFYIWCDLRVQFLYFFFFFLHVDMQFPQNHLLKIPSFPYWHTIFFIQMVDFYIRVVQYFIYCFQDFPQYFQVFSWSLCRDKYNELLF